jgi:preprotein translocase SecE subunit
MSSLTTYFHHVREEFKHIVWPSRQTAIGHTLVVIVIAALITILVAAADYILGGVVSNLVGA